MAMQLVHLVIPFLIILNFPSLKKQVLMQTMQRLMVGTCIAITYYMYIMYAVYYRCACEIIHSVLKSLGT